MSRRSEPRLPPPGCPPNRVNSSSGRGAKSPTRVGVTSDHSLSLRVGSQRRDDTQRQLEQQIQIARARRPVDAALGPKLPAPRSATPDGHYESVPFVTRALD